MVPRDDNADLAARLREGEDMVRTGRALIRAAENLGARADIGLLREATDSSAVDFGVLPGRSAEARAEALYLGRRMRDRLFPDGLFAEPAWDLLLALFLAQRAGNGVAVDSIFVECRLPSEAGPRFIALLDELGLIDDRTTAGEARTLVALSRSGMRLMKQFFDLTDSTATIPKTAIAPHRTALLGR